MKILEQNPDMENIPLSSVKPREVNVTGENINIFNLTDFDNIEDEIVFIHKGKPRDYDIFMADKCHGLLSERAKSVFEEVNAVIKLYPVSVRFSQEKGPGIIKRQYWYYYIPTRVAIVDFDKTVSYKTWVNDSATKLPFYEYLDGSGTVELDENQQPLFKEGCPYVPTLMSVEKLAVRKDVDESSQIFFAAEDAPVRPLVSDKLADAITAAHLIGVDLVDPEGYTGV